MRDSQPANPRRARAWSPHPDQHHDLDHNDEQTIEDQCCEIITIKANRKQLLVQIGTFRTCRLLAPYKSPATVKCPVIKQSDAHWEGDASRSPPDLNSQQSDDHRRDAKNDIEVHHVLVGDAATAAAARLLDVATRR